MFIVLEEGFSYNMKYFQSKRGEYRMKRMLFIYNPKAGRQKGRAMLPDLLENFSAQGYEITAYPTQKKGDATERARHAAGFDRVVCCGGDGTMNEVVSGLLDIPAEERPPLGYVPAGSANDYARSLNLPKSLTDQAVIAGSGTPRLTDMGNSSGHYFTYISAFGLFTEVSYSTPQTSKNLLGHFAYLLEGAKELTNIPSYRMEVTTPNGFRVEGEFIYGMVGNTVSMGGVFTLPREKVKLDDGLFEVLLIRKPKTTKDWQSILTALAGQVMVQEGAVIGFAADKVTFRSDKPVAWTVDGEFGGEREETTVTNLHRAVQIACL